MLALLHFPFSFIFLTQMSVVIFLGVVVTIVSLYSGFTPSLSATLPVSVALSTHVS